MTSKVGTKAAALNNEPEHYLESIGEMNKKPCLESFEKVEKHLVVVLQKNSKCTNFNELMYEFLQQNLFMKLKYYNHRSSPQRCSLRKVLCKSAVHLQDSLYRINTGVFMQLC